MLLEQIGQGGTKRKSRIQTLEDTRYDGSQWDGEHVTNAHFIVWSDWTHAPSRRGSGALPSEKSKQKEDSNLNKGTKPRRRMLGGFG